MKIKSFIFFLSLFVLSLLLVSVTAHANRNSISRADIAIGGISLGATENYVRSIYGEPDEISYDNNSRRASPINRKIFRYGTSFFVVFDTDNNSNAVWEVKSTGNNGLKTPVGFTVGMNISEVRKYYGQGRGDENHLAYNANWQNIMFTAKKGTIVEIRIYSTT